MPVAHKEYAPNELQHPSSAVRNTTDVSTELPDEVIRLYAELDDESRAFLKFGPRSAVEKLAYAQRVSPFAFLSAEPAQARDQRLFADDGDFDDSSYFIGPDRKVYVRDQNSREAYGARIRRGYEQAVGGFPAPTISHALSEIAEATRTKRADIEAFEPPLSEHEQARRKFLRDQRINPSTWTQATPMDDDTQRVLRETGTLLPYVESAGFVGPDNIAYFRNDIVKEDKLSQERRVREWQEDLEWRRAHPDPNIGDVIWTAIGGGAHLPNGRFVRHDGPTRLFVPPDGVAQRAEAQSRLSASRIRGGGSLPAPKGVLGQLDDIIEQGRIDQIAVPKARRSDRTRAGVLRSKSARLRTWNDLVEHWDRTGYEDLISPGNRFRLKIGLSPKVDKNWIVHHPEDAGLIGQTIDIHHVLGSAFTVPLPKTRHRDAHMPGGYRDNHGGPGGQAPFYFTKPPKPRRAPKKPRTPRKKD